MRLNLFLLSFFIIFFLSSPLLPATTFIFCPCASCRSSLRVPTAPYPSLSCPLITLSASSSFSVLSHRNLSSADAGRQTMRNYSGLIDSLMAYVQNCVAASRCDDKVRVQTPADTSIPNPEVCAHSCKSQGHTLKLRTPLVLTFLSQNPRVRATLSEGLWTLSQRRDTERGRNSGGDFWSIQVLSAWALGATLFCDAEPTIVLSGTTFPF